MLSFETEVNDAIDRYVDHHMKLKTASEKMIARVALLLSIICNAEKVYPMQVFSRRKIAKFVLLRNTMVRVLYDNGMGVTMIGKLLNRKHSTIVESIQENKEIKQELYEALDKADKRWQEEKRASLTWTELLQTSWAE